MKKIIVLLLCICAVVAVLRGAASLLDDIARERAISNCLKSSPGNACDCVKKFGGSDRLCE